MVRFEEWKLIVRRFNRPRMPRMDELYNLEADPGEKTNLIDEPESAEMAGKLAGWLVDWGREINDPVAIQLGKRYAGARP